MIRLVLLLSGLCGAAWADQAETQPAAVHGYRIVREGIYWTRVDTGIVPAAARLRVITADKVSARGDSGSAIQYTLRRRVRARDFEAAKRFLGNTAVVYTVRGEWGTLRVSAHSPVVQSELDLRLPKGMRQTALDVEDGTVTAVDLNGSVLVNALAGSVIMDRILGSVEAHTGGGEIRLGRINGSIRCLSGGGGIFIDAAGADSFLETAGGEVSVREARGPVRASSGGGNIQVMRAMDRVEAQTNGGTVEVPEARGMVHANTSGGAIHIGAANGVWCQSSAGAIELRSVTGALQASAMMGSILVGLGAGSGRRAMYDSFLKASAGDITVFIPSNLALTIQAENEAAGSIGKILSDFPEIQILGFLPGGKPLEARGTLNGGGPRLRLSATGGIIYLKRQH